MNISGIDSQVQERHDEVLALINMIGYAVGIAESLGSTATVSQLKTARQTLAREIQAELSGVISIEGIDRLVTTTAGRC